MSDNYEMCIRDRSYIRGLAVAYTHLQRFFSSKATRTDYRYQKRISSFSVANCPCWSQELFAKVLRLTFIEPMVNGQGQYSTRRVYINCGRGPDAICRDKFLMCCCWVRYPKKEMLVGNNFPTLLESYYLNSPAFLVTVLTVIFLICACVFSISIFSQLTLIRNLWWSQLDNSVRSSEICWQGITSNYEKT